MSGDTASFTIRDYGPIDEPVARKVAAYIRFHDAKHTAAVRSKTRRLIADLLDRRPNEALNIARRIDRTLRLHDLTT